MVPQDGHNREAQSHQGVQYLLHLLGLAIVGEVARHYQDVSLVSDLGELFLDHPETR
jgi:hypothetical protein